jgi:hypothetical protein
MGFEVGAWLFEVCDGEVGEGRALGRGARGRCGGGG